MATSTEMVKLSVEVEEKLRISFSGEYSRDVSSVRPNELLDWVDTYIEAYDKGIELLARFDFLTGFSIVKEVRRVVPIAEPVVN